MSPAEPAFNPDTTERQDSPSLAPAPVPPGLAPWDFKEQQREYFTKLLGGKWDCEIPGHSVCVPTEDGQHHQLSDEKFAMWVDALCRGDAIIAQPPEGVLTWNGDGDPPSCAGGLYVVRALEPRPSSFLDHVKSPALAATASLRESFEGLSTSQASSGVPGPGYYSGKAMKWLGERCLNTLEDIILFKRTCQYTYYLKRWQNRKGPLGVKQQKKLFKMLENALDMSRACYSFRVNRSAMVIRDGVYQWAKVQMNGLTTRENASYLGQMHVGLSPLGIGAIGSLHRASNAPSLVGALAWELLNAVTRVPLALQDSEATSAVISILGRELAYSPYNWSHRPLGYVLTSIIAATSFMRALTAVEMAAIHAMATRRLQRNGVEPHASCRPWEVVIFAECSSQDPACKEMVLGPRGLQSLLSALDVVLSKAIIIERDEEFSHLKDILLNMQRLSLHTWITSITEPRTVVLLLNVLRRSIAAGWFRIRYRAVLTIQNIVSDQPRMLHTLIRENAAPAFASFTSATIPRRGDTQLPKLAIDAARKLLKDMEALRVQLAHKADV